jgi:hypothetical protein
MEEPPVVQILRITSAFYGNERRIIVFARALNWALF